MFFVRILRFFRAKGKSDESEEEDDDDVEDGSGRCWDMLELGMDHQRITWNSIKHQQLNEFE